MIIFKRLLIIFCTLAITSFASDQADRKQVLTKESQPYFEAGIKFYKQGCGSLVHEGLVVDVEVCLTAMSRLKQAVSLNPTLVDANLMLAELYFYQPSQMNWQAMAKKQQKRVFQMGYKHTLKAIEYAPTHPRAKKLFSAYFDRQRQIASE